MKGLKTIALLAPLLVGSNVMAGGDDPGMLERLEIPSVYSFRLSETQGLNLTSHFTPKGIVHIDEEKNVMITSDGSVLLLSEGGTELQSLMFSQTHDFLSRVPDKIVAKAPNEKAVVQVFTDASCPHCQQLHQMIPQYNQAGITLEFILYARNGFQDQNAIGLMSYIEGRADPLASLSDVMNGLSFPMPPSQQMLLHQQAGMALRIERTPAMFYKGRFIGVLDHSQLIQAIGMIDKDGY